MAIPVIPTSPEDRKVTEGVTAVLRKLFATVALLNGRLIDTVALASSGQVGPLVLTTGKDVAVQHSLGRPAKGYFVVKANGPGVVYQSASVNPLPNQQIILVASATVTVSLWVF